MAVSYVGVSSGNSAGGTSTSFVTTLPTGWAAGDVAVLTGHVRGTSLTMATPAGWTLVPGPAWPVAQGTNSRLYAWYRVLQAGDVPPTITNSGAMTGGWSMTAYRGGNAASPIGQVGTSVVSGTSLALPSLVGVLAGSALAVAVHAGVSTGTIPTNITPDAAYTEVADHATSRATTAANQRMEAAYRLIASAGSYGGETVTSDVTGSMIGVLVEATPSSVDLTTNPDGIAVPVAVGSPAGAVAVSGSPDGLTVPATVGAPAAAWSTTTTPDGLTVPVEPGDPTAAWAVTTQPDGLAVPVELGTPSAGGAATTPDGLVVDITLGEPETAWSVTTTPDGLLVPVTVGAPTAGTPGQGVTRPVRTSVARPTTTAVARPVAAAAARPRL